MIDLTDDTWLAEFEEAEDAATLLDAARRVIPALLRVARAAQARRQAEYNYNAWFNDDEAPSSAGDDLEKTLRDAERELEEVLDALEATP